MIVSKLQTLREEFHRLCNDVSAGSSSENASKVDFGLLDADVGPVDALGIWGCRAGVARYLVQECGFPANFADERQMLTERPHTNDHSSLSEGLYLWRLPTTGTVRPELHIPTFEIIEPCYKRSVTGLLLLYPYDYAPLPFPPSPPLAPRVELCSSMPSRRDLSSPGALCSLSGLESLLSFVRHGKKSFQLLQTCSETVHSGNCERT